MQINFIVVKSENHLLNEFTNNQIIPALDELHLMQKEILNSSKINKGVFGILLLLAVFFSYYEIEPRTETEIQAILITVILFIIVTITYVYTKPYTFISKSKVNKLSIKFKKEIILKTILFSNSELKYTPIFKTNKKQLIKSKLFPEFTEYKEDDGIYTENDNFKLKISEVHMMNKLRKVFDGLFIYIKLKETNDLDNNIDLSDQILKNNSLYLKSVLKDKQLFKYIEELKSELNLPVTVSVCENKMFLIICKKEKLFEISLDKLNRDEIIENIELLYKLISNLKRITSHININSN